MELSLEEVMNAKLESQIFRCPGIMLVSKVKEVDFTSSITNRNLELLSKLNRLLFNWVNCQELYKLVAQYFISAFRKITLRKFDQSQG